MDKGWLLKGRKDLYTGTHIYLLDKYVKISRMVR